jgi:hypothetical protein
VIVADERRAAGPGGVERRRFPRLEPAELAEPVLVIGSHLVNISRGGVRLEAPVPLAPESLLQLHLVVGGERADVEARVRGCAPLGPGRRARWGVGLEFVDLDPVTIERLERALTPRKRNSS